jgi:hypothetical protein
VVTRERSRVAPPARRTAGQYAGFGIRVFGHLLDTRSIIHLNEREQKTLSVLLNVRRDTVRDWRSGRNPIRPQVWSDLLSLIVHQREELSRVEQEVRAMLAKQGDQP